MSAETQPVLIAGEWRTSKGTKTFQASNPKTREKLPELYPVSPWDEIEEAIEAASAAADELHSFTPEKIADFLEKFADRIEARDDEISDLAEIETALPKDPRLKSIELPRTTGQIRQAAAAARDRSWCLPTIDSENNVRSVYRAIGPVCVFGPNNFPLAFGSVAGGDFAAAIAAGNPVIGKANSSHPGTTMLLAEEALRAANETGMPAAIVQLLYRADHDDGKRMVAHPKVGATGYTGSRSAGLALKAAADAAGIPIYLELSSINPVIVLPGALNERSDDVADEFLTSVLMGTGQFCTNPGLVLMLQGDESDQFVEKAKSRLDDAPVGTLLSEGVERNLLSGFESLQEAGAELVTGGEAGGGEGFCCNNTLLKVSGEQFLNNSAGLQEEAFGNSSLFVISRTSQELKDVIDTIEGNLTGCIYSHSGSDDDELYSDIEPHLRKCVGRLINDKMPTGVLVSEAMNHGGPYPATGHPGFTAVGIPASLLRFGMLQCYDNVREERLPGELRDKNPTGGVWRRIDGEWTHKDVGET